MTPSYSRSLLKKSPPNQSMLASQAQNAQKRGSQHPKRVSQRASAKEFFN